VITRQARAGMVVGGPTTVLDLGGLRIVSDPTFDAPGPHGYLTKTAGPAVEPDELGPVDLVLVSHDNHPDNLDDRGRALALAAPLVLTTRSAAGRLGHPAIGLAPWTSHAVDRPDGGSLTVTAVPAVHGPEDGERDANGFVNCEVVGGGPTSARGVMASFVTSMTLAWARSSGSATTEPGSRSSHDGAPAGAGAPCAMA
jgi:L-ascorbate metabolism protein UlaG (beta-lactamase superfamily)